MTVIVIIVGISGTYKKAPMRLFFVNAPLFSARTSMKNTRMDFQKQKPLLFWIQIGKNVKKCYISLSRRLQQEKPYSLSLRNVKKTLTPSVYCTRCVYVNIVLAAYSIFIK